MDDFTDVLEVQCSEHGRVDFHPSPEQCREVGEEDVHLLRLGSLKKVEEILKRYGEMTIPRDDISIFQWQLTKAVNAWFVEVGDVGLVYFTDMIPTFTANMKVVFWDKKLGKVRRDLIQRIIATAVSEFKLTRVQAMVPITNVVLAEFELRKIGFTQEGVLRKNWREAEGDVDLAIFGLLKEETETWEPLHLAATTSSALTT